MEEIGAQPRAPRCSMTRSRRFPQTANKMSFKVWRLIQSDQIPQSLSRKSLSSKSSYKVIVRSHGTESIITNGIILHTLTAFPSAGYAWDALLEVRFKIRICRKGVS